MPNLTYTKETMDTEALTSSEPVEVYRALRVELVQRLATSPPGVVPAIAKQIADLTRAINEAAPARDEPNEVDQAAAAFNAARSAGTIK